MPRNLLTATLALLLLGCGSEFQEPQESDASEGVRRFAATTDLPTQWQAFLQDSAWNLRLSPTRSETPVPASVLALGPIAPNDGEYGVKIFFASASDPTWQVRYSGYNPWDDNFNVANPLPIRIPANITAPTGSDGSVIVVDEARRYAYEMWQWRKTGTNAATVSYVDKIDLASSGIHRNVGLTGSGLPASAGVLKSWETSRNIEIRHKIWLAVHPSALYARATWPAPTFDAGGNGSQAFFSYGDVVAITKNVDINTVCGLSPFVKRIARALQDYGGIVQDQGGDLLGLQSEVGAISNYVDIDYNSTLWTQLACLKPYLVRVTNPWTGATPGGLGYGGTPAPDTSPPTPPATLQASPMAATQVTLDWSDSSDNVGVAGYRVFRDNVQVATSPSSAFQDASVQPSTRYNYFVRAYDSAGNISNPSTTVSATTPAPSANPELVTNPGFESTTAPWTLQKWTGNPTLARCTNRKRGGASSFCITNGSGQDGAAGSPLINVTAGARYVLSGWLSLENVSSGSAELMLDWLDARGALVKTVESTGRSSNTTGWLQESITATAPTGAVRAYIYLFSYARGKVYYDDISFKRQ